MYVNCLHIHGALKTGISKSDWDLFQFFKSLYNFFKDLPGRRANYSKITCSTSFLFKLTLVRWLENGCCDQTLQIFIHINLLSNTLRKRIIKTWNILEMLWKIHFWKQNLELSEVFLTDMSLSWEVFKIRSLWFRICFSLLRN